ncbi:hypothetical protein AMTRI_Chr08g161550 [Amborella trichopoda]
MDPKSCVPVDLIRVLQCREKNNINKVRLVCVPRCIRPPFQNPSRRCIEIPKFYIAIISTSTTMDPQMVHIILFLLDHLFQFFIDHQICIFLSSEFMDLRK